MSKSLRKKSKMATEFSGYLWRIKVIITAAILSALLVGLVLLLALKPILIDQMIDQSIAEMEISDRWREMTAHEQHDYLDVMARMKTTLLPVVLPLAVVWNLLVLTAVWREWHCFTVFLCVVTLLTGIVQLIVGVISGYWLLGFAFAFNLLLCYYFWQLASLIRLKKRQPQLFDSELAFNYPVDKDDEFY